MWTGLKSMLLAVVLIVSNKNAVSQSVKSSDSDSLLLYLESQSPTRFRDTTLIRLYSLKASQIVDLDSSLSYLQRGFELALKLKSSTWLSFIHNQIGSLYLRKGVSFKAIEYLYKGLQYAELSKDTQKQAFSWNFIGECYAILKICDKAIAAKNRAIELYLINGDLRGKVGAMNDLGAILGECNRLVESTEVLKKSLSDHLSLNNPGLETAIYQNLAATYLKREDYTNSEKYGILALETEINSKGRGNAELISLLSLITSIKQEPDAALNYADRAGLYLPYEWPLVREKTAYNLYLAYKNLEQADNALLWHEKYLALREINTQAAQKKRIEILRYEYDAQQRENTIRGMTADMEKQNLLRNALIACILIFIGLVVALLWSNLLLRRKRKELDTTNLQLFRVGQLLKDTNASLEDRVEERTRELSALNRLLTLKNHEIQEALFQGQSIERKRVASELHNNLGSLLSGIKWRLESIDSENLPQSEQELHRSVVKLITDAYNQVRHISHNLLPSILEEEGLVPALEKLISDLNRSGKANFEIIYASDAFIEDKKIAFELYSCVLELINNVLKHAGATRVVVELVLTESFYILLITDNGIGMNRIPVERAGFGLDTIRQRVKSLQGSFSIYPLKNKQGTLVSLRIPRIKSLIS